MLPCLAIASSVTAIGQQMIKTTKTTVEDLYNATVIYGAHLPPFPLSTVTHAPDTTQPLSTVHTRGYRLDGC